MHSSFKSRGGPWGFGQILFRGYLGLSENLGGPLFCLFCVLLHLYVTIFRSLPPPPRVHLWISWSFPKLTHNVSCFMWSIGTESDWFTLTPVCKFPTYFFWKRDLGPGQFGPINRMIAFSVISLSCLRCTNKHWRRPTQANDLVF